MKKFWVEWYVINSCGTGNHCPASGQSLRSALTTDGAVAQVLEMLKPTYRGREFEFKLIPHEYDEWSPPCA